MAWYIIFWWRWLKQPCKLASKNEVSKFMWPLGFVGPCMDLINVNICAFLIQFAHMKNIFICDVCGCYQGLLRGFVHVLWIDFQLYYKQFLKL